MYCRNCGKELNENADYCTHCGVATTKGNSYCGVCGSETNENADICVSCGTNLKKQQKEAKSKVVAGLLGIFLGAFGIHRCYLGYTVIAVIQLVLSIVLGIFTCGIATAAVSIWGLVEGILILCGSVITTDANGQPLQ